jgi:Fe-S cluster assembly scaffold protein SufB
MDKNDLLNSIRTPKEKDAWRFFDFNRFESEKENGPSLSFDEKVDHFTTSKISLLSKSVSQTLQLKNFQDEVIHLTFIGDGVYTLFINGENLSTDTQKLTINLTTATKSITEFNLILININKNFFLTFNTQLDDNSLKFNFINLYSSFVRFEPNFNLKNEKSILEYNGLNILNRRDFCDTFSNINHYASGSTSSQVQKNVVDGNSKSVFTGNILIEKNLKEINAKQISRNILISKEATSLSRPQLEIYSFDVKCAHGSSTGQLNDDEFFYFSSRGIKPERAKKLLLEAQANEVLLKIQDAKVREQTGKWVHL